ncbi:hypothetical protein CDD81_5488 [Ophiocordyceps australis]|uniref:Uncharacterized protein n=1 Tax=Ophiocordyceps australis TaxID=1399860 RepID=A0A2C5XV72_9HYPO|nr:hypothetical protein CDD81_5488 [Ophiocordyceps australis]
MAPPRTGAAEVRYQLDLAMYRVCRLLGLHHGLSGHVGRLALFLVKLAALAQPCWPYVTRLEVALPLLLVAALDLGVSRGGRRVPLDVAGGTSAAAAAAHHDVAARAPSGMVTSLFLVALHFGVLWLARRWNVLCVVPAQHDWGEW